MTGEGFFYRVDMRLRPDGIDGALVRPLASYLSYYEERGELWERQMLIKARRAAGSTQVWRQFRQMLVPFVFPGHFADDPRQEIARVKQRIEAELASRAGENNIKLQPGGIRDIEFIVQCLQLLNGHTHPQIRAHNTLTAIERLRRAELLRAGGRPDPKGGLPLFAAARKLAANSGGPARVRGARRGGGPPNPNRTDRTGRAARCGLEKHCQGVRRLYDAVFS